MAQVKIIIAAFVVFLQLVNCQQWQLNGQLQSQQTQPKQMFYFPGQFVQEKPTARPTSTFTQASKPSTLGLRKSAQSEKTFELVQF